MRCLCAHQNLRTCQSRPFFFLPMMPCLQLLHSVNGDKPLYIAFLMLLRLESTNRICSISCGECCFFDLCFLRPCPTIQGLARYSWKKGWAGLCAPVVQAWQGFKQSGIVFQARVPYSKPVVQALGVSQGIHSNQTLVHMAIW